MWCPAAATEKLKRYLLDNHIVMMSLKPPKHPVPSVSSGVRKSVPVVCDNPGESTFIPLATGQHVAVGHEAGDYGSGLSLSLR